MGVFRRISEGLTRSRDKFKEGMNVLLSRGPNLDEEFWEELEDTLVLSDIGGQASFDIVENLRDQATRLALPDAYAVLDLLKSQIVSSFAQDATHMFEGKPAIILFVGINGTGKTTTVGKIAYEAKNAGRNVILGSADTFRAAAIEQLQVWADRAGVEMVTRERGSDPASVCYDTIERAEALGCDLVLIDTAGRLHTSDDLMRELEKVVNVVRKRANADVYTVLVIDATTGQNGVQQAREFNKALNLDGLIVTKLDGTAKGGIALAISHELDLPILKIGVGESIDDLKDFNADDYVSALIGDFEEDDLDQEHVYLEDTSYPRKDPAVEDASKAQGIEADEDGITLNADEPGKDGGIAAGQAEGIDPDAQDGRHINTLGEEEPASEETETMTWDQFVAYDDAQKAKQPQKKHFWEKW